jgi:hypothetical protein
MKDSLDIVKNISEIYNNDKAFSILKDFERVLDDLDVYVYENWMDGELVAGPKITRHWVTCSFMWPKDKMPDPMGGKRNPDDIRPMTKKGKLDTHPIWVVEIMMPKKLIADIYSGYEEINKVDTEPGATPSVAPGAEQSAEMAADATADAVETV